MFAKKKFDIRFPFDLKKFNSKIIPQRLKISIELKKKSLNIFLNWNIITIEVVYLFIYSHD